MHVQFIYLQMLEVSIVCSIVTYILKDNVYMLLVDIIVKNANHRLSLQFRVILFQ